MVGRLIVSVLKLLARIAILLVAWLARIAIEVLAAFVGILLRMSRVAIAALIRGPDVVSELSDQLVDTIYRSGAPTTWDNWLVPFSQVVVIGSLALSFGALAFTLFLTFVLVMGFLLLMVFLFL